MTLSAMNLGARTCHLLSLVALLGSSVTCGGGDSVSGPTSSPDLLGTWLARLTFSFAPSSPGQPRFCETGEWDGFVIISSQIEEMFSGTVDFDFEGASTACAEQFLLDETISGSVTPDGDATLVIGSTERMRQLAEAITQCSAASPVEPMRGFAGPLEDGALLIEVINGLSTISMQCAPDDEPGHVARFFLLATIRLPPDSPLLPGATVAEVSTQDRGT